MGKRSRPTALEMDDSALSARSTPSTSSTAVKGTKQNKLKYKATSQTSSSHKRHKTSQQSTIIPILSLEGSLSEEILLRVLSNLEVQDLINVARVSSAWYRLSQDSQLWKSLYLRTYSSPRRRSFRNDVTTDLTSFHRQRRPWKELYKISTNWRNGSAKSSKVVLRESVRKSVLPEVDPREFQRQQQRQDEKKQLWEEEGGEVVKKGREERKKTLLLQFYQQYFFSAHRSTPPPHHRSTSPNTHSTNPMEIPSITVSQSLPTGESIYIASITSQRLSRFYNLRPGYDPSLSITEIRLDTSSSSRRNSLLLAVFFSTGQFAIFELTLATTTTPFSSREVYTSLSISTGSPLNSHRVEEDEEFISISKFHFPLLVTCSNLFTLRFYRLSFPDKRGQEGRQEEEGTMKEEEEDLLKVEEFGTPLQTRERWAPVVLSLDPIYPRKDKMEGRSEKGKGKSWSRREEEEERKENKEEVFKVCLAYSQPVFPNDWTVGLREFTITLHSLNVTSSIDDSRSKPSSSSFTITTTQAAFPPIRTPLSLSRPRHTTSLFTTPSPPRYNYTDINAVQEEETNANPVTSIELEFPWIVTSRTDNTLQVYRIIDHRRSQLSSSTSSSSPSFVRGGGDGSLKIVHEKSLFGHTARVNSLALIPQQDHFNVLSSSSSNTNRDGGRGGQGKRRRFEDEEEDDFESEEEEEEEEERSSTTKCISAGNDGSVKVWNLSSSTHYSSRAGGGGRRSGGEGVIEVVAENEQIEEEEEETSTEFQRLKRRRAEGEKSRDDHRSRLIQGGGLNGEDENPREKIRKIFVDEDKIVVVGITINGSRVTHGDEGETIRVLKFD